MLVAEINSPNQQIKTVYWFTLICILYVAFALVGNYVLVSDEMYFDLFGEQLAYDRIVEMVETGKKWRWIGYILLPIFILFKCFFVVCCLSVGVLLANVTVSFKEVFRIAIISELVFIIPSFVKIFWFGIFFTGYTMQDLQYFSPLSLLNIIDREKVDVWFIYPLQVINVFELLYWAALAYGMARITQSGFIKMFRLVALSYGTALLLWVVFVVFLTVSISA
jgi:hypothetical protein